jgi:alpha-beta hydrolase superfamily lysophospholipase
VAHTLREAGLGTLLFDLLTDEDERIDLITGKLRFDLEFLARRLVAVTHWLLTLEEVKPLGLGYFGSSTGGGAALVAAAQMGPRISAVVSRGGRPDLALNWLPKVKSPTLLLVGELDPMVIDLNQDAMERMSCPTELRIIPDATHLFEEPGALETVAHEAAQWFADHFRSKSA